jgi:hypothetical protein
MADRTIGVLSGFVQETRPFGALEGENAYVT